MKRAKYIENTTTSALTIDTFTINSGQTVSIPYEIKDRIGFNKVMRRYKEGFINLYDKNNNQLNDDEFINFYNVFKNKIYNQVDNNSYKIYEFFNDDKLDGINNINTIPSSIKIDEDLNIDPEYKRTYKNGYLIEEELFEEYDNSNNQYTNPLLKFNYQYEFDSNAQLYKYGMTISFQKFDETYDLSAITKNRTLKRSEARKMEKEACENQSNLIIDDVSQFILDTDNNITNLKQGEQEIENLLSEEENSFNQYLKLLDTSTIIGNIDNNSNYPWLSNTISLSGDNRTIRTYIKDKLNQAVITGSTIIQ